MKEQRFADPRISAYFSHLVSILGGRHSVVTLAVAHMVPNSLLFLPAIAALTNLGVVLPKPKSVGRPEYKLIKESYETLDLSRELSSESIYIEDAISKFAPGDNEFILVDIGGYFASIINIVSKKYGRRFLGVVEGTENGAQRYDAAAPFHSPVVTVARSPLKLPEDFLVASSVVFSVEATLRSQAEILQTRTAAVIGYGRVGSSVAEILRGRGISTVVYDTDPIKLADAAAKGFRAQTRLSDALSTASLVICATGRKSLSLEGFAMLRSGAVVASVTSADDELDLDSLREGYDRQVMSDRLTKYEENRPTGRYFLLVADGNAANFLDGAIIGPAIQLIEGEKLAAIAALAERRISVTGQVAELDSHERSRVAEIWNEHFL